MAVFKAVGRLAETPKPIEQKKVEQNKQSSPVQAKQTQPIQPIADANKKSLEMFSKIVEKQAGKQNLLAGGDEYKEAWKQAVATDFDSKRLNAFKDMSKLKLETLGKKTDESEVSKYIKDNQSEMADDFYRLLSKQAFDEKLIDKLPEDVAMDELRRKTGTDKQPEDDRPFYKRAFTNVKNAMFETFMYGDDYLKALFGGEKGRESYAKETNLYDKEGKLKTSLWDISGDYFWDKGAAIDIGLAIPSLFSGGGASILGAGLKVAAKTGVKGATKSAVTRGSSFVLDVAGIPLSFAPRQLAIGTFNILLPFSASFDGAVGDTTKNILNISNKAVSWLAKGNDTVFRDDIENEFKLQTGIDPEALTGQSKTDFENWFNYKLKNTGATSILLGESEDPRGRFFRAAGDAIANFIPVAAGMQGTIYVGGKGFDKLTSTDQFSLERLNEENPSFKTIFMAGKTLSERFNEIGQLIAEGINDPETVKDHRNKLEDLATRFKEPNMSIGTQKELSSQVIELRTKVLQDIVSSSKDVTEKIKALKSDFDTLADFWTSYDKQLSWGAKVKRTVTENMIKGMTPEATAIFRGMSPTATWIKNSTNLKDVFSDHMINDSVHLIEAVGQTAKAELDVLSYKVDIAKNIYDDNFKGTMTDQIKAEIETTLAAKGLDNTNTKLVMDRLSGDLVTFYTKVFLTTNKVSADIADVFRTTIKEGFGDAIIRELKGRTETSDLSTVSSKKLASAIKKISTEGKEIVKAKKTIREDLAKIATDEGVFKTIEEGRSALREAMNDKSEKLKQSLKALSEFDRSMAQKGNISRKSIHMEETKLLGILTAEQAARVDRKKETITKLEERIAELEKLKESQELTSIQSKELKSKETQFKKAIASENSPYTRSDEKKAIDANSTPETIIADIKNNAEKLKNSSKTLMGLIEREDLKIKNILADSERNSLLGHVLLQTKFQELGDEINISNFRNLDEEQKMSRDEAENTREGEDGDELHGSKADVITNNFIDSNEKRFSRVGKEIVDMTKIKADHLVKSTRDELNVARYNNAARIGKNKIDKNILEEKLLNAKIAQAKKKDVVEKLTKKVSTLEDAKNYIGAHRELLEKIVDNNNWLKEEYKENKDPEARREITSDLAKNRILFNEYKSRIEEYVEKFDIEEKSLTEINENLKKSAEQLETVPKIKELIETDILKYEQELINLENSFRESRLSRRRTSELAKQSNNHEEFFAKLKEEIVNNYLVKDQEVESFFSNIPFETRSILYDALRDSHTVNHIKIIATTKAENSTFRLDESTKLGEITNKHGALRPRNQIESDLYKKAKQEGFDNKEGNSALYEAAGLRLNGKEVNFNDLAREALTRIEKNNITQKELEAAKAFEKRTDFKSMFLLRTINSLLGKIYVSEIPTREKANNFFKRNFPTLLDKSGQTVIFKDTREHEEMRTRAHQAATDAPEKLGDKLAAQIVVAKFLPMIEQMESQGFEFVFSANESGNKFMFLNRNETNLTPDDFYKKVLNYKNSNDPEFNKKFVERINKRAKNINNSDLRDSQQAFAASMNRVGVKNRSIMKFLVFNDEKGPNAVKVGFDKKNPLNKSSVDGQISIFEHLLDHFQRTKDLGDSTTVKPVYNDASGQFLLKGQMALANHNVFASNAVREALDKYNKATGNKIEVEYDPSLHESGVILKENGAKMDHTMNHFDGVIPMSVIKQLTGFDAEALKDGVLEIDPDRLRIKHLKGKPLDDTASWSLSTFMQFLDTKGGSRNKVEQMFLSKMQGEVKKIFDVSNKIQVNPQNALKIIEDAYGRSMITGNLYGEGSYLAGNGAGFSPHTATDINRLLFNIMKEKILKVKIKGSPVKMLGSVHTSGKGTMLLDDWVNANKPEMKDNWVVLDRKYWGNRVNETGRVGTTRHPINKSIGITAPKVLWLDELPARFRDPIGKNAILNPQDTFLKKEADFDGDTMMVFTDEIITNPDTVSYIESFNTDPKTKNIVVDVKNGPMINYDQHAFLLVNESGALVSRKDVTTESNQIIQRGEAYATNVVALTNSVDLRGENWTFQSFLNQIASLKEEAAKYDHPFKKSETFLEKLFFSKEWEAGLESRNKLEYNRELDEIAHNSVVGVITQKNPDIDPYVEKQYKKTKELNQRLSQDLKAEFNSYSIKMEKKILEYNFYQKELNKELFPKKEKLSQEEREARNIKRKYRGYATREHVSPQDRAKILKFMENIRLQEEVTAERKELTRKYNEFKNEYLDKMSLNKDKIRNLFRDKMTEIINEPNTAKLDDKKKEGVDEKARLNELTAQAELKLASYEDFLINNRWNGGKILGELISEKKLQAYYDAYFKYYQPANVMDIYGLKGIDLAKVSDEAISIQKDKLSELKKKYSSESDPQVRAGILVEASELSDLILNRVLDHIQENTDKVRTLNASIVKEIMGNEGQSLTAKYLRSLYGRKDFTVAELKASKEVLNGVIKKVQEGEGDELTGMIQTVMEYGSSGLEKTFGPEQLAEIKAVEFLVTHGKNNSDAFKSLFTGVDRKSNKLIERELAKNVSEKIRKMESENAKFDEEVKMKRSEIANEIYKLKNEMSVEAQSFELLNNTLETYRKIAAEADVKKQEKHSSDYLDKIKAMAMEQQLRTVEDYFKTEKSDMLNTKRVEELHNKIDKKINEEVLEIEVEGIGSVEQMMKVYSNAYKSLSVGMAAGRVISESIQTGMLNFSQRVGMVLHGDLYTKDKLVKKHGKFVADAGDIETYVVKQEYKHAREIANLPAGKVVDFLKKRGDMITNASVKLGQSVIGYGRVVSKMQQTFYERTFYKSMEDAYALGEKNLFRDRSKLSTDERRSVNNKINELKRKAMQETREVYFSYAQHPQVLHNLESVIPFSNFLVAGMRLMTKHPNLFLGAATTIEQFQNTYGDESYYIDEDGQKISAGKSIKMPLLKFLGLGSVTMDMQRFLQISPQAMSSLGTYPLYAYATGTSDWRVKNYLEGKSSFFELAGSILSPSFSQLSAGAAENDPKKWLPAVSYLTTGFAMKDKSLGDIFLDYNNGNYAKVLDYNSGARENFYRALKGKIDDSSIRAQQKATELGILNEAYDPFEKAVNILGKALASEKIIEVLDGNLDGVGDIDSFNALVKTEAFAHKQLVDFIVGKKMYTSKDDNEWLEKVKEFSESDDFSAFEKANPAYYRAIKHYTDNYVYYKSRNDAYKLRESNDENEKAKGSAQLLALKYRFIDAGADVESIGNSIINGKTEPMMVDGKPVLTPGYTEELNYKGYMVAETEERVRAVQVAKSFYGMMTGLAINEPQEKKKNYFWSESNKYKAIWKKAERELMEDRTDPMNMAVAKLYEMKLDNEEVIYGSKESKSGTVSNAPTTKNSYTPFNLKYYQNIVDEFINEKIKSDASLLYLKGKSYQDMPAQAKLEFKTIYGKSAMSLERDAQKQLDDLKQVYPETFQNSLKSMPTINEEITWTKPNFNN